MCFMEFLDFLGCLDLFPYGDMINSLFSHNSYKANIYIIMIYTKVAEPFES